MDGVITRPFSRNPLPPSLLFCPDKPGLPVVSLEPDKIRCRHLRKGPDDEIVCYDGTPCFPRERGLDVGLPRGCRWRRLR